jgi:uncharacterized membrane-anchored protein YitT (DUF2179 family)
MLKVLNFPVFKKPNSAIYARWVFYAGLASFIANPTLIRFPLYITGSKTGKLQLKYTCPPLLQFKVNLPPFILLFFLLGWNYVSVTSLQNLKVLTLQMHMEKFKLRIDTDFRKYLNIF